MGVITSKCGRWKFIFDPAATAAFMPPEIKCICSHAPEQHAEDGEQPCSVPGCDCDEYIYEETEL